jgi:hypothetical protein
VKTARFRTFPSVLLVDNFWLPMTQFEKLYVTFSQEISAGTMVSPLEPSVPITMLAGDSAVSLLQVVEERIC